MIGWRLRWQYTWIEVHESLWLYLGMLLSRPNFWSKSFHFQDVYWHGAESALLHKYSLGEILKVLGSCLTISNTSLARPLWLHLVGVHLQQHTTGIWCMWFYYHLLLHTVPAQEQQISLPHSPAIEFSFKGLASLEPCPLFPWLTANVQIVTQKFCTGSGGAVNLQTVVSQPF
jgi:hypothetical protein